MTSGAIFYLSEVYDPPIPGLAVLATFIGAVLALHGTCKINLQHSDRLAIALDVVRVGGLTVLCLTLLAFGRVEAARAPLMLLAITLAIIFLIQALFRKGAGFSK